MLSWLADHATTIYWVLALIAVGFVVAWYMTRRTRLLGIAISVVAIMGVVFLLTRLVVSDRQQIENNLHAMKDAVIARQPDKFVSYLAKDFQLAGKGREEWKAEVEGKVKHHAVSGIRVWDIDIKELDRDKKTADVEFRMRADGELGPFAAFCISTFKYEEGVWKMLSVKFRNPVNTKQPIGIPD